MKYIADYQIALPDGIKIPLLFNTWAFRQFCRKVNIELEDLILKVGEGKAFKGNDLPDLLLIAAQSFKISNNQENNYTDLDACEWVDALGGFNSMELVKVYKHFVSKLLNVPLEKFDAIWDKVVAGEEIQGKEDKKKGKAKN